MSWLVEHVQNVDQEFGRFLKEKNITLTEES
jgi:hemerythrin